ncbi:hypothetical protein ACIODS_11895 [Micromonospora chalcea]|uniref:hypothetical protein n=1 Tax=Micromonospora chalcea TaxID=1874 RepID=UPI00382CEC1C
MVASATIGHTATEIRPTRVLRDGDGEQRTIRVRRGRGNSVRAAIAASYGYGRR